MINVNEEERHVGGRFNSALVYEHPSGPDVIYATIGGLSDIPLSPERAEDLRDVLTETLKLVREECR